MPLFMQCKNIIFNLKFKLYTYTFIKIIYLQLCQEYIFYQSYMGR